MRVIQHPTPKEFIAVTADFRARNAALTNIIGSVATAVVEGRTYESASWYSISDDEVVVGCAMRTPPWLLAVSPMPDSAARELADVLTTSDPQLPGIVGPRSVAEAVADRLGRSGVIVMTELVRVLGTYQPPRPTPGQVRFGEPADLDLAIAWWLQFAADAGLPMHDTETLPERLLEMMAAQRLLLWTVDGEPVALGGHASPVTTPGGTVGRIGPIYTPAALRGRGYGTAVTAAVVEHLQPRCDVVMLFTDELNPTSNGIYAGLGFEPVAEIVEMEFEAQDASRSVD
jgi:predicted GNAT family acetyltransferase